MVASYFSCKVMGRESNECAIHKDSRRKPINQNLKGETISMKKLVTTILASSVLLGACSGGGSGSESTNANSASESGVSGTIQFYTSQPDSDAAELVAAFNEKHPEVEVDVFRSGTEEVMSKVGAEKMAGDIQADVLLVADEVTLDTLKEQGLLMPYESPESKSIPSEWKDENGMYTGTKVMSTVMAVNTNKVKELPASWSAMTDPQAKGEVVMPSPLYSGAAAYNVGVLSRQDGFGWEFFGKLRDNDVKIVQGNGGVLQAVAGGEQSYGMVVDYLVARAKAEGSPVDIVYPEEGVPVITEPIGIMKDTDNEEAAKAFVDFVLSEEGQTLAAELGYTPIREGIEVPEGLKKVSELKVLSHDVKELLVSREEDKQQFTKIIEE